MDYLFAVLNQNKLFNGIMTMALHIGGRYISEEIPKNVYLIFNKPIVRRIFIFCVSFISTRDIKLSILLTLLFIFLFNYLFNENSKIFILNEKKIKEKKPKKDENYVSQEELNHATKIIKKYNKYLDKNKIVLKNIENKKSSSKKQKAEKQEVTYENFTNIKSLVM